MTTERPRLRHLGPPAIRRLTIGGQTITVSSARVARMADRIWRLQPPARRLSYAQRARERFNASARRSNDVAIVLALGGESKK